MGAAADSIDGCIAKVEAGKFLDTFTATKDGITDISYVNCADYGYDTGYYCPGGSQTWAEYVSNNYSVKLPSSQTACPVGSYCVNGTKYACPEGFTSTIATSSKNDCFYTIPSGKFFDTVDTISPDALYPGDLFNCEGNSSANQYCPKVVVKFGTYNALATEQERAMLLPPAPLIRMSQGPRSARIC